MGQDAHMRYGNTLQAHDTSKPAPVTVSAGPSQRQPRYALGFVGRQYPCMTLEQASVPAAAQRKPPFYSHEIIRFPLPVPRPFLPVKHLQHPRWSFLFGSSRCQGSRRVAPAWVRCKKQNPGACRGRGEQLEHKSWIKKKSEMSL